VSRDIWDDRNEGDAWYRVTVQTGPGYSPISEREVESAYERVAAGYYGRPSRRRPAGYVPFTLKLRVSFLAAVVFLAWFEVLHGGAGPLYVALGLVLPVKALRWEARRRVRAHAVRRVRTRRIIQQARETAVAEGLWFPEADGSISIGGQPIRLDDDPPREEE
jgi:hypothetical protein